MMSRFWSSIQRLVTVALFVATCGALLYAQSTTDGAIGGTVYDTNGAVVANAKIVVRNNGTNAETTITTDGSGFFRVNKLQPGTYTVAISQQGFAPFKAEQVIVQVGSVTDLSPRLAIGSSTETVEVTAEAPQINSTSADFCSHVESDCNFQPSNQWRALVKLCRAYSWSRERRQRFRPFKLPRHQHTAEQ